MATEMTNAAPTCAQIGGNTYQYDWNDMGGTPDTYNYGTDMQYNFYCTRRLLDLLDGRGSDALIRPPRCCGHCSS